MWFNSLRNLGDLRDYYFMMTQTTLTMMIGATGARSSISCWLGIFFLIGADRKVKNDFGFGLLWAGLHWPTRLILIGVIMAAGM